MKINAKAVRFIQWSLFFVLVLLPQILLFSYEKEIKNISQELAREIETSGKKSIAVVDFNDLQGILQNLGGF